MCFAPLEGPGSQRYFWPFRLFCESFLPPPAEREHLVCCVLAVPKRTLGTVQSKCLDSFFYLLLTNLKRGSM